MRRFLLLPFSIVAMMMAGCQVEKSDVIQEDSRKTYKVVVNASAGTDTRTSISAVADGYKLSWSKGDCISLLECAPAAEEYYFNAVKSYDSASLAEDAGDVAAFSFDIIERTAEDAVYTYVAGYAGIYEGVYSYYESAGDDEYLAWCELFDYSGEYVGPHMVVRAAIPYQQSPTADSFDPSADLLISDTKVTTEQLNGEVAFQFARIGTVVKVTLTGLDEYKGMPIIQAELSAGESMDLAGIINFDTYLGKYEREYYHGEDGFGDEMGNCISISPYDLFVKDNGTADLWLRTFSGKMTDWFSINLSIGQDDGVIDVSRHVDLAASGKSIVFPEGKMTVFSVGGWLVADVCGPEVTYVVNDDMDGFTAKWDAVENASGYTCSLVNTSEVAETLTAVDNGDGTWQVSVSSGLNPDIYTLSVSPIPVAGHTLIIGGESSVTMNIGVPSQWGLAHDAFNYWRESTDCDPIGDGEYIISRYSLDKVRFKNLKPEYQSSWQALVSTGEWFMYSTIPFKKIHSIEIWSKDDSYKNLNVYASASAGVESVKLEGVVVEESVINTSLYSHTHKKVRYSFPSEGLYQYYTINGTYVGTLMTSQYTYIYYYE